MIVAYALYIDIYETLFRMNGTRKNGRYGQLRRLTSSLGTSYTCLQLSGYLFQSSLWNQR